MGMLFSRETLDCKTLDSDAINDVGEGGRRSGQEKDAKNGYCCGKRMFQKTGVDTPSTVFFSTVVR